MKRKILIVLLAVALVCAYALGLTACGEDGRDGRDGKDGQDGLNGLNGRDGKDGVDGQNGNDGIGIKSVEFNSEREITVTYTDDRTINLGKLPDCQHNFSDWTVGVEATCNSIGYETRECGVCNYTEYRFIQSSGHSWDEGTGVYGTNILIFNCENCNETKVSIIDIEVQNLIMPVDDLNIERKYEFIYNPALGTSGMHMGLDFGCEAGTSVYAVLEGTVTEVVVNSGRDENYVSISHSDGLTTTYKYITAVEGLQEGDKVKQGYVIGTVTPAAGYEIDWGDHLHFEILKNGNIVDPEMYFDFKN